MVKSMFGDMTMTNHFSSKGSRIDIDMGFMSTTAIVETGNDEVLVLMDMFGMKNYMVSSASDYKDDQGFDSDVKPVRTTSTKEIAGYECIEYEYETESLDKISIWVSEELVPETSSPNVPDGLNGMPLEFSSKGPQGMIQFKAISVSLEKPSDDLFSTEIPDGYTEMDLDKIMEMSGGMGK